MFISNSFDKKLKLAFELYNQNIDEYLPEKEQLSAVTFSEKFENKMQKLIYRQKKSYYYLINTVGKRVAIILLTFLIAVTSVTFGVKAIRETVINFITETYEKFTTISTDSQNNITKIEIKVSPQYIPDGYNEESVIDETTIYSITYNNKDNIPIIFNQEIQSNTTYNVNTEEINFERTKINRFDGISYTKNGFNTIVFADENYYYLIMGKLPMEELEKMAKSIFLGK